MPPLHWLRSLQLSSEGDGSLISHGSAATTSARAQLGYVLRRSCTFYFRHLICSRSQLDSKLDEYKYVVNPMKRAICLGACGASSATRGRILSGLSSECFSAFSGNQSQIGSGFQSDGANNCKGSTDRSPVTGALLISYLVTYWAQFSTEQRLFYWGAKVNSLIIGGQIWRLLTSAFLHANVIHLMANYHSLHYFGPEVEMCYGTYQFLGIYLTSALSGSVMSFLFEPRISVGGSGAIFGLVGASWVYNWRHRHVTDKAKEELIALGLGIAVNVAVGLMLRRYIDNWCHVGGLLGGAAFSWHCPVNTTTT